jgi:hypothetical protein
MTPNWVAACLLCLALPPIVIWLCIIMFLVAGIEGDLNTIIEFIEASPTPEVQP